jgi:hypothetical protein
LRSCARTQPHSTELRADRARDRPTLERDRRRTRARKRGRR